MNSGHLGDCAVGSSGKSSPGAGRHPGQTLALFRAVTSAARCLLWCADVEDRGGPAPEWDTRLLDEEAARRLIPIAVPVGHTFAYEAFHSRIYDDRDAYNSMALESLRANSDFRSEFRYRCEDGSTRWFTEEVHVEPVAPGKWWAVGVVVDITAQKQAEIETREREQNLRYVLLRAGCLLWRATVEKSPEGWCAWSGISIDNDAPARFMPLEVPPGTDWWDSWYRSIPKDDRARMDELATRAIDERWPGYSQEFRCSLSTGEVRWIAEDVRIEVRESGVWDLVGVCTDITQRKEAEVTLREFADRLEQRVQERTAQLEAMSQAKSEFLSRTSHELRTPLNAILGFGQLLDHDKLAADDRDSVDQILRAGRHLLKLINEVLELSRIEAGHLPISLEPVQVLEIAREALDLVRPAARARRLKIVRFRGAATFVMADRQRLTQVLLNLVSNAVKYNRDGGSIELLCDRHPRGRVRIGVRDTGDGIEPQHLAALFEPFERLGVDSGGIEGTGLGLALSRRLVELMGGDLEVQSEVGQGCTFWVELPAAVEPSRRAAVLEAAAAPSTDAAGTVLYVEDNLPNLRLIERILQLHPRVRLIPALQGRLGIDLARHHRPDLVLLDLHLPDIKGDEVLRQLRADPETSRIPVVILSADATQKQVDRLLDQGAAGYLTKPLDIEEFARLLERHLRPSSSNDEWSHIDNE